MSQYKDYQNEINNELSEGIERLFDESSENTFLESILLIGKEIVAGLAERERNTAAKAPHIRGIMAAQEFERFIKDHRAEVKHFDKYYCELSETINYDVILPERFLERSADRKEVERFSAILIEVDEFEFTEDKENPRLRGMVYLGISFPALIRVYKNDYGM